MSGQPFVSRCLLKTLLSATALLIALKFCNATIAADLAEQAHSLRKVPADTAFYSSSLRMKEQWQTFLDSHAYEKLMQIPLVQLAKGQLSIQWDHSNNPQVVQVREYLESPAGKDARALLEEMWSEEIFAYAGSSLVDSIKMLMDLNSIAQAERAKADDNSEASKKAIVQKVVDLAGKVAVPTVVIGFRIEDADRAKRELDEVHSLLRNALDEHQADLAAHLQREQVAGHEFLMLRLDGSMIPWEKLREETHQVDEEQFNSIRDSISKQTLVVGLGVIDEFVLLSVGPTTDHLAKLGQSGSLADQPAIARLQKHSDQKVVSLTYMSKAFAESFGSAQKTMDDITASIEQALVTGEVDEADRKTLLDDIRSFNLAKFMPEPGEMSGIAFLTARGYEGFQYTTARRPMLDATKPLSILSHAGSSPLLLIAARSKKSVDDYNQFVAWFKKLAADGEMIAEKKADADDWAKYQKIRDRGIALLQRLDTATVEQLFPALAGGDSALVIDLNATSKKWFKDMPESPKPLPMFEAALVSSVNDAEKLRQGASTYLDVAKDAARLAKELDPDKAADFEFPKAIVSDISGGGKMYAYPFPEEWGVDSQITVNAALTDKFAVASFMPKTSERLLQGDKVDIDTSLPLDKPAALVTHVEFAKFIDATRPWIDYGLDVAMGKLKPAKKPKDDDSDDSDDDSPPPGPSNFALQAGFIVPQLQQFLDVATTLRSATSMTYEEGDVWITRSETHIEDLK